ncbi:MAG: hypothetical protein SF052_24320 [Bacteroidia bacterium]|nr:hypothetical protein [Bacteroidia bacterium]
MNQIKFISGFLLLVLTLTVACEEQTFKPIPPRERTFLHFLNVYSGYPAVDIRLTSYEEARTVADGVTFKGAWPSSGYASMLTTPDPDSIDGKGGITIEFLDHATKDPVVPARTLKLAADVNSTICLVDSFGKPLIVKTVDNFPEKVAGKALVRFMNLNYAALSVSLYSSDDSVNISKLNFLNYSSFAETTPSTKTFFFKNDFSGNIIGTISNVNLEAGKVYSFYLTNQSGTPSVGYEVLR